MIRTVYTFTARRSLRTRTTYAHSSVSHHLHQIQYTTEPNLLRLKTPSIYSNHTDASHSRSITTKTPHHESSRAHSSITGNTKLQPTAAACPFTGGGSESKRQSSADDDTPSSSSSFELTRIPTLPVVGSIVFPSYSGIPNTIAQPYSFWPEMRRRFGDAYVFGFPLGSIAKDIWQTTYVTTDPREFMKVIRTAGAYPYGMAQNTWATRAWARRRNLRAMDDLVAEGGPAWKRLRTFFQKDLLHPASADGYLPGFIRAAELASRGAPASRNEMNAWLNRVAFDMFSSLMLGDFPNAAGKGGGDDDLRFVTGAATALNLMTAMIMDVKESVLGQVLGVRTEKRKILEDNLDICYEVCSQKIDAFLKRREKGELTDMEQFSYLNRALIRQSAENSDITHDEVIQLAFSGLLAGVDTTAGKMAWNLLHIARLPHVQRKLHDEISHAVATVGHEGRLTPAVLKRENTPYLHATVRESHRLTPVAGIFIKRVDTDRPVTFHGTTLEKHQPVIIDLISLPHDPKLVDRPNEFIPERWFEDAVRDRKGTEREIIDHPLFRDPFSQGARKCPGSRVAANEIETLLAQLVLDWKITCPVEKLEDVEYGQKTVVQPVLPTLEFEARR